MKKSLFVLLSLSLLASCSNKTSISYSDIDKDKAEFSLQNVFKADVSAYFSHSISVSSKDGLYYISYTIDGAKNDYHKARVLLSPDMNSYFPFGYDNDYTLVNDKTQADKDSFKYYGIVINFCSTVALETIYARFGSNEKNFYYTITIQEK